MRDGALERQVMDEVRELDEKNLTPGGHRLYLVWSIWSTSLLVRAPASAGRRQIWADLDGAMADDFDELPEDFAPYS